MKKRKNLSLMLNKNKVSELNNSNQKIIVGGSQYGVCSTGYGHPSIYGTCGINASSPCCYP
jgi:hypothetical protein